jgi:pre-rRNA-processing protein TSR4
MADEDFDDDVDDGGDDGEVDTGVQLGFISKTSNSMFSNSDWENWDGGKVGGKPSWLNPCHLPLPEQLRCKCCSSPMTFLLQIYCPLDDVEDAFHRSLYIFVCKKKKCVDSGSIKCLRCQLGRENEYYPYTSKSAKTIDNVKVSAVQPKLCNLCGCRAPSVCSKCKLVSYCTREHQAKDWKYHKRCCAVPLKSVDASAGSNSCTFPEFDLSISAEILEDLEKVDALNKSVLEASIWENATEVEVDDCSDDEEEKTDAELTQTDYNTALGNEASDTIYTKFMERVRRGGSNQVLRYIRWDDIEGPLTLSSTDTTTSASGRNVVTEQTENSNLCLCCGSKRRFEFQIMPQMLHFLRVDEKTKISENSGDVSTMNDPTLPASNDAESLPVEEGIQSVNTADGRGATADCLVQNKNEEDIDWGTIDVYTCTASCTPSGSENAYIEEVTYVQRPLSFMRAATKQTAPTPV